MSGTVEDLAGRFRRRYGEGLRAVVTYDREGYELAYTDGTVRDRCDEGQLEAIHDDVLLADVAEARQEELYGDMGGLCGGVRTFEDGTVAHLWPESADRGVFVAFHDDVDPRVRSLEETVRAFHA